MAGSTIMTIKTQVDRFDQSVKKFASCIEALSEKSFLRKLNGWSPRDVVAHLIGWNRYYIIGCDQIRQGELPFYYVDPGEDFSKVNAAAVQLYDSTDAVELLHELEVSYQELARRLFSVDPNDWTRKKQTERLSYPVSIEMCIQAISDDYVHHQGEIEAWLEGAPAA